MRARGWRGVDTVHYEEFRDSKAKPSSAHHPGPSTAAWLPGASNLPCQPPSPLKPPASLERPAGAKRDPARLSGEREVRIPRETDGCTGGEADGHMYRGITDRQRGIPL